MQIELLHHVSLGVRDLERSRAFYRDVLGLKEITRPPFDFPGAWLGIGATQQYHLIVHPQTTFRGDKGIDTRENHLALRVASYQATREYLHSKGYREDAGPDDPMRLQTNPHAVAGFPQMYIVDPDRHVIEINADRLD